MYWGGGVVVCFVAWDTKGYCFLSVASAQSRRWLARGLDTLLLCVHTCASPAGGVLGELHVVFLAWVYISSFFSFLALVMRMGVGREIHCDCAKVWTVNF